MENHEYTLLDFDSEADFEEAVIENKEFLFGKNSVYLDVKHRIGIEKYRGIPDAFLIDFFDINDPQLYLVENELSRHDIYSHITEQIARFNTTAITSPDQIRKLIIRAIDKDANSKKAINEYLIKSPFKNLTDLVLHLVEKDIKVVIAINELSPDLNLALKIFKSPPDTALLQRYQSGKKTGYYYEPMRDEVEDIGGQNKYTIHMAEFDTVVCAAYPEGFKEAYVDKNAWWAIRLSQESREKLKYLAMYQKSPIASISHYAEIEKIEPYKDTGKFIVYVKNKQTIRPLGLGKGKPGDAPQSPRYTTLKHLLKAKQISDLWYWR